MRAPAPAPSLVDEPVFWRRYASTRPVSDLHRRAPGAARTRCGIAIPALPPAVARAEGEVCAGAAVHEPDWDGLRCARCYPPAERPARPSRARWQRHDRERELRLGLHSSDHVDLAAGAVEIWGNGRGAVLIRWEDRWELRSFRPGVSGTTTSWARTDGRRPRLTPPTRWANATLAGR